MPSCRLAFITWAGLFASTTSAQNDQAYASGSLGEGPYTTYVSSKATPPLWNHVLPINDTIKPQLTSGLIFGECREDGISDDADNL
jgi:hypothetical protein